MVDRVRRRRFAVAVAVAWTVALALLLHTLDRVVLGDRPGSGWVSVKSPEAIPREIGPIAVPAYLPDVIRWPPRQVHYRTGVHPGWWLGLGGTDGEIALWIGNGGDPVAPALGAAGGCVLSAASCPDGWRALSAPLAEGRTVYVITRLKARAATLILQDLHW